MPANPFTTYLDTLKANLSRGNATEHTHRAALATLLQALGGPGVTATNEPKREKFGAPDYVITNQDGLKIGYVEAKDIGVNLDEIERDSNRATPLTREGKQLARYRAALPNLLLTDYLDFRWFVNGVRQDAARLARLGPNNTLTRDAQDEAKLQTMLAAVLGQTPQSVNNAKELAGRLARLADLIHDIVLANLDSKEEQPSAILAELYDAFQKTLIPELNNKEFADMYAQTLAYGLFAARANHQGPGKDFNRTNAAKEIPKTNPFLRQFFDRINGLDLEDEPYVGLVDELAQLLAWTDMAAVLANFGKHTRQEDPILHFYETFLQAYNPRLKEMRGVYYTPEPVVSYIVRSVDALLKTHFNCRKGLADTSTTRYMHTPDDGPAQEMTSHRVLILDPACGTGTFLYAVVNLIREQMQQQDDAGLWPDYVRDNLLPRLFGFELLMAPYAVAHLKLGLQLAGLDLPDGDERRNWRYDFAGGERLGVYLTNTLDEARQVPRMPFARWLADETNAAAGIKREKPIMVVLGNPPYSGHSANRSEEIVIERHGTQEVPVRKKTFIGKLVQDYYFVDGHPLGEASSKWLQDDYVKFLRFGQWRISKSGQGILAFITNHGYLDNVTFRGMRQSLMQTFSDIYILNLHGSSKKREKAPDGGPDANVFDIQQGVAIGLFVKDPQQQGPAQVHYADLWGTREAKYQALSEREVSNTVWTDVAPQSPFYLFVPQNVDLRGEYDREWKVTELMQVTALGFQSHRDPFAIDFNRESLRERIKEMRDTQLSDQQFATKYGLQDNRDWQLSKARQSLRVEASWDRYIIQCEYRPFDWRWCYFNEIATDYPRRELVAHVAGRDNLAVNLVRQTKANEWAHVLVSNNPTPAVFLEIKDGSSIFPLYLYPEAPGQRYERAEAIEAARKQIRTGGQVAATDVLAAQDQATALIKRLFPQDAYPRWPNLSPAFLAEVGQRLGLGFVPDGQGDLAATFGPEDVFHYLYAVLHSPTYRARYAEFLKIDFPRVPLTGDLALFRDLAGLGRELVAWHLLDPARLDAVPDAELPRYPVAVADPQARNRVDPGYPKYVAPNEPEPGTGTPVPTGRVYVNKAQYFSGIEPEVWAFQIGGYQVAEKWLKDRRGRQIADIPHYRQMIVALRATIRLMAAIDARLPGWPLP